MAKAYGKFPSEVLSLNVHDYNLNSEILCRGDKAESDARKKSA
jgi:hypothetical protein